jgi:hypothetical protein
MVKYGFGCLGTLAAPVDSTRLPPCSVPQNEWLCPGCTRCGCAIAPPFCGTEWHGNRIARIIFVQNDRALLQVPWLIIIATLIFTARPLAFSSPSYFHSCPSIRLGISPSIGLPCCRTLEEVWEYVPPSPNGPATLYQVDHHHPLRDGPYCTLDSHAISDISQGRGWEMTVELLELVNTVRRITFNH